MNGSDWWQSTPTEAAEAAIARNEDGGAAERVLGATEPPRAGAEPLPRAEAPGGEDGPRPESLSAGAGPGVEARAVRPELPGWGERLLRWRQMPFWRLVTNRIPGVLGDAVAEDAARLAQLPVGMMEANRRGLASSTNSVEARARGWQWAFAQADAAMRRAFYAARGWNPDQAGPLAARLKDAGTTVGNWWNKADDLTMAEFRQLVGRALHTGLEPVDKNGIPRPEALRAAEAWTKFVYEPMEEAGADAGLLLTPRHAALAQARLDGELARQRIILADLEERIAKAERGQRAPVLAGDVRLDGPNSLDDARNLRGMAQQAIEMTERRLEQLLEREGGRGRGIYAPQRWLREVVQARRDELEAIFRRHFVQDGAGPKTKDGKDGAWASNRVRASVAVSHILREGMADTLERAVLAHLRGPGGGGRAVAMPGSLDFSALAAEIVAPLRALEAEDPSRWWRSEVASALGKTLGEQKPISKAARLAAAAVKQAGMDTGDSPRLIREILSIPAETTGGGKGANWTNSWRPAAVKDRQIDVPAAAIIEFLDTDVSGISQSYLRFMAPAVETAREFGDAAMMSHILARGVDMLDEVGANRLTRDEMLESIEALANLRNVTQRIHAVPDNPDAYSVRVLRGLANFAVVTKMGSALIPNLLDAARGTMAVGFKESLLGMKDALENRAAWRLGGDEAAKAGAAPDLVTLEVTAARNDTPAVVDGVQGVLWSFNGVPNSTSAGELQFETGETLTPGTVNTISVFVRLVSGATGFSSFVLRNASEAIGSATAIAPTSTLARVANTTTNTNAAYRCRLGFAFPDTVTPVSCTLFLGWPQREMGARWASSPIMPPTGTIAASTRLADALPALGVAGPATVLMECAVPTLPLAADSNMMLAQFDAGADADRLRVHVPAGGTSLVAGTVVGGVATDAPALGTVTPGGRFVLALRHDGAGTLGAAMTGGSVQTLSGGLAGVTSLLLGNNRAGTSPLFGLIRQARLFPRALGDAELLAAVA